jgi:PAS domain-containing protein
LRPATPLAEEGLLVPFYVHGTAVGTIWVIAHATHRTFDTEELRLLESLGRFASAAYQALASIDDLTVQIAAREKAEAAVRALANGLEAKLRRLVDANIIGRCLWHLHGQILEANDAFLRLVGYDRNASQAGDGQDARRVPRRPHPHSGSARPPPPKVVAALPKG